MVRGMRSPVLSIRTMTNWPVPCFLAICGAMISKSLTFRAKRVSGNDREHRIPPIDSAEE